LPLIFLACVELARRHADAFFAAPVGPTAAVPVTELRTGCGIHVTCGSIAPIHACSHRYNRNA
jgi:hypothetical protein